MTPDFFFELGLILALVRNIPAEDAAVRAGGWQHTLGTGLAGKTLGLLGLGRLGARVARVGAAFDMRVVAWSANLTEARAAIAKVRLPRRDPVYGAEGRRCTLVRHHRSTLEEFADPGDLPGCHCPRRSQQGTLRHGLRHGGSESVSPPGGEHPAEYAP